MEGKNSIRSKLCVSARRSAIQGVHIGNEDLWKRTIQKEKKN